MPWAPWVVGGGFYWDALADESAGGFASNDTAVAYEADEDLAVALDADGRATALTVAEALQTPLPTSVWALDLVYGVDATFLQD